MIILELLEILEQVNSGIWGEGSFCSQKYIDTAKNPSLFFWGGELGVGKYT